MKKLFMLLIGLMILGAAEGLCQSPPGAPDPTPTKLKSFITDYNYQKAPPMVGWDSDNNQWVLVWTSSEGAIVITTESGLFDITGSTVITVCASFSNSTGTALNVTALATSTIAARVGRKLLYMQSHPADNDDYVGIRFDAEGGGSIVTSGEIMDVGDIKLRADYTGAAYIRANSGTQDIRYTEYW